MAVCADPTSRVPVAGRCRGGAAGALLLGALLPGCGPEDLPRIAALPRAVEIARDGDRTITGAGNVINRYGRLASDARRGDRQVSVSAADLLALNLSPDDLILLMQVQGAALRVPADVLDPAFGEIGDLGGAGAFELIRVTGTEASGRILLDGTCGGLRNDYQVAGRSQIVRVPQFRTLRVNSGGTVVPTPWNGSVGGVLAFRARFGVTLAGNLDASGAGFRGGAADRVSGDAAADQPAYYGKDTRVGADKGEGVGGYQADYDDVAGRFGRGAAGNGGGGGSSFKAGGGGGGGAGSAATWSGQGVMSDAVAGAAEAWPLDPAYLANGNARTASPGGGRGGYSQSLSAQSPRQLGPGQAAWGGNQRRERGGLGGRPLLPQPQPTLTAAARLFLGGGGGAGDAASVGGNAGAGGRGGGVVHATALSISGDGKILASGARGGAPTTFAAAPPNAGAGGGGGGGAVVLDAPQISAIAVEAGGGGGGDQPALPDSEADGPGGGGGGGFIAIPAGVALERSAPGGAGGSTAAAAMNQAGAEFPANGATAGAPGVADATLQAGGLYPSCIPVDLAVQVSNGQVYVPAGGTTEYTVTVTNQGPYDAYGVVVRSSATPALRPETTWTCSVTARQQPPEAAGCSVGQGAGDLNATLRLPAGGVATFKIQAALPAEGAAAQAVTVTAAAPANVVETDSSNNTASDSDPAFAVADLSIIAGIEEVTPIRGGPMTYILGILNSMGPSAAQNVRVTARLPIGVALTGAPEGDGWSCEVPDAASSIVQCRRPRLDKGQSGRLRIPLRTDPDITFAVADFAVEADSVDPGPGDNRTGLSSRFGVRRAATPGGGFHCAAAGPGAAAPPGPAAPAGLLLLAGLRLGHRRPRRRR